MVTIKFPEYIIRKLKNNAPTYDVSENYGRNMGYYGDADKSASGYKSICIYAQNGLADFTDLFKEIARGIFRIQGENQRKYSLVVFGFGNTAHLQHEKKYFDFGYLNDSMNTTKIAETITKVSGTTPCNPAIIPEFFPITDIRSLYSGKTRVEKGDLLIIIGRENEVFLNEDLKDKMTNSFLKQILMVEIGKEEVLFKTGTINLGFKILLTDKINTNYMATPTSSFKRNFSTDVITKLEAEPLYQILHPEILAGHIFPGIRNEIVDFYYKGGRLFKYDKHGFQTHIKYAAVIEKGQKDYLTEKELGSHKLATDFSKNLQRIKENCEMYAGVEANGVSEIYHGHSYAGRSEGIVVLDIEVSLKSINPDAKQDRIDFLIYNSDEKKLKFVEAKHYSNSEIWSNTQAKVISQIKRYEAQIKLKKNMLIVEYNKYIDLANSLFASNLPHVEDIDEKVTLLVFGFDNDQKNKRLKNLITKNPKFVDTTVYSIGNIEKIKLDTLWKA